MRRIVEREVGGIGQEDLAGAALVVAGDHVPRVVDAEEEQERAVRLPKAIRVDQGCQFISKEIDLWAYANGVTLNFSRPGKPTDNADAESFNASVRLECLGQHWFMDLDDARQKIEDWRREYNEVRPHNAIDDRTPMSLIHQPRGLPEASKQPEILT